MSQLQENQYLKKFTEGVSERFSIESLNMSTSEWLFNNTTLKKKPFSTDRYPFQRKIADDMHPDMCTKKPSQVGLACKLNTPIFTTKGWSTMEGLKIGDKIFDEQGNPTSVTYKSPVWTDRDCYEITFCTGEKITTDGSHRWYVEGHKAFHPEKGLRLKTGRIRPEEGYMMSGVVNTKMISENFKYKNRNIFAIPCTKTLSLTKKTLPIDPYFLGLWLGDGSSGDTTITGNLEELESFSLILRDRGFTTTHLPTTEGKCPQVRYYKENLRKSLKREKILNNKHIPEKYLTASYEQRLELIQGLLDTDGSITKRGRVSFHNTNQQLVEAFQTLVHSIGYKTHTRWREVKGKSGTLKSGQVIKSKLPIAEVSFNPYTDTPVFKLNRKLERQKELITSSRQTETFRRRIVNVEKVPTTPTQCITVDSPNHLFLVGRGMIPTHNTEIQIRKAAAFLARNKGTKLIFTLPNEDMFKRISIPRIQPIINGDKVFNPPSATKPTRSQGLMQIGSSYLYIVPAIESAATSIDADAVFIDEVDLSNQQMLALFNSRMQNSDHKLKQSFSTPTYPNYGIDAMYDISDKHVYFRKCDACNHYNNPSFNRNFIHIPGLPSNIDKLTNIEKVHLPIIDLNNSYVKCERCHSRLDMANHSTSQWVAEFNDSPHLARGYAVTPFSTERLPPSYIVKMLIEYRSKEFIRGFHNTVLGEPYSDGNIQISADLIKHAFDNTSFNLPELGDDVPVWAGIDVGQICHIVLGKGTDKDNIQPFLFKAINVSELDNFIKEIQEKYNLVGGAIDREPYEPTANHVLEMTNGRILPVDYTRSATTLRTDALGRVSHAMIARTQTLDFVHTRLKRRDMKFNGYGNFKSSIETHLRDMVREEQPEKPTIWKKLTNNDHFFHALGFLLVAPELRDVVDYKDKEDKRLSVLFSGAEYAGVGDTDGLFNFGQSTFKRNVDKKVTTRVLR